MDRDISDYYPYAVFGHLLHLNSLFALDGKVVRCIFSPLLEKVGNSLLLLFSIKE